MIISAVGVANDQVVVNQPVLERRRQRRQHLAQGRSGTRRVPSSETAGAPPPDGSGLTPPIATPPARAMRSCNQLTEDHRHRQREDLRRGRGGVDGLGKHVEALWRCDVVATTLCSKSRRIWACSSAVCAAACVGEECQSQHADGDGSFHGIVPSSILGASFMPAGGRRESPPNLRRTSPAADWAARTIPRASRRFPRAANAAPPVTGVAAGAC